MASIVIECPSCSDKLETAEANIGRDGECPACGAIFEIQPPERFGGTAAAPERALEEYQDSETLASAGGVAVCLVLLAGSAYLQWADPGGAAGSFVGGEKFLILLVSVACGAFMAVSAATESSLIPSVMLCGGWGMIATIWTGGLLISLRSIGEGAGGGSDFAPRLGLYVATVVSLLLVAATALAYYRFSNLRSDRHLGIFVVSTETVGALAGLLVVLRHVSPALDYLSGAAG